MKSIIYKYPVTVISTFPLELPDGPFEVLAVQMQEQAQGRDLAMMWVKVNADPAVPKVTRMFRICPTGTSFDDEGLTYVGTFQPQHGLVFHLFTVAS